MKIQANFNSASCCLANLWGRKESILSQEGCRERVPLQGEREKDVGVTRSHGSWLSPLSCRQRGDTPAICSRQLQQQ